MYACMYVSMYICMCCIETGRVTRKEKTENKTTTYIQDPYVNIHIDCLVYKRYIVYIRTNTVNAFICSFATK